MRSVLLALVLLCAAAPAAQADLVSRFDAGPEGWTLPMGSGSPVPASWQPAGFVSHTANGNGFTDGFSTPPSWGGDRSGSAGRRLTFDIRVDAAPPILDFVMLIGGSELMSYDLAPAASPDWQHVELVLDEGAGWRVGGRPATRADFQRVLGNLNGFGINAENDPTVSTASLDNVVLEQSASDLAVSVDGPSTVALRSTATSTVTVTNRGPEALTAGSLVIDVPFGPRGVQVTAPSGSTCTGTTQTRCTIGALAAGASKTWSVVWVAQTSRPPHILRATVATTSSADPTAANDTASMDITVGRAALPPPKVGQSVNVSVVSGKVRVREPGKKSYRLLGPGEQLPVGTSLDLSAGRIALTAAVTAAGKTETSQFYGGGATVTQSKGAKPITELRLDVKLSCKKASSAAGKKKTKNSLWGDGKGNFRTRGRYGSAAVRGTKWLTRDQCDGTLIKVAQGSVLVRDFVKRRNVVVRSGRSYLAKRR